MLEGEAKLDSWRAERTGFPEVVFGPGKSAEQVAAIMRKMAGNEQVVMATRIAPEARPPAPCPVLDLMARLFGSDDRVAMAIRNPRHGVCLGVRACSAADQVSGLQHVHARPVEPAFRTAQGRMCVVGAVRAVSRRMRLRLLLCAGACRAPQGTLCFKHRGAWPHAAGGGGGARAAAGHRVQRAGARAHATRRPGWPPQAAPPAGCAACGPGHDSAGLRSC